VTQLDLFATTATETAPVRHAHSATVRAILGARFDGFVWWCRTGNRSMCAAVLWRTGKVSPTVAAEAVDELASGVAP
jgi:hypothetical protein